MNLEIIGMLKINERLPERVEYFFACLDSIMYLGCRIQIMMDTPSPELFTRTGDWLEKSGMPFELYRVSGDYNYGEEYRKMLATVKKDFVMNMIEDHVSVIQDSSYVDGLLADMKFRDIDVMRASFHKIEVNSLQGVRSIKSAATGSYFDNNAENFKGYEKYYGRRFYIGINWITSTSFAKRFWSRHFNSKRPHEWEVNRYDHSLHHKVMVPNEEFLCSLEDSHGEPGTCLLERPNHPFWKRGKMF